MSIQSNVTENPTVAKVKAEARKRSAEADFEEAPAA